MTAGPQNTKRTAAILSAIVLAMIGLAFASAPLYRAFCAATGFGGTPLRAERFCAR